jgi:hypothetical protein
MLAGEKDFLASPNCGISNAGAALPINGDGTSWGSRFKPIARKTTSTINSTRGIKNLALMSPVFLT